MKAVIVYESMYGNTRAIADAIGAGLRPAAEVTVVGVADASQDLLLGADLVVAGGPTHAHGMSRPATRKSAIEAARKPGSQLEVERGAQDAGMRDWLGGLAGLRAAGTAFDTRMKGPAIFTGRAAKGIAKLLRRSGLAMIAPPESFLVTKGNELYPGQVERAREWGGALAARMSNVNAPVR